MPKIAITMFLNVLKVIIYKPVILCLHITKGILYYVMNVDSLVYKELLFSCTVANANMICVKNAKVIERTNKIKLNLNVYKTMKWKSKEVFLLFIGVLLDVISVVQLIFILHNTFIIVPHVNMIYVVGAQLNNQQSYYNNSSNNLKLLHSLGTKSFNLPS